MNFENRAVAFIDILGFKGVVESASRSEDKLNELRDLIHELKTIVPELDGMVDGSVSPELIPRHIYISDSIILSAPTSVAEHPRYCGLSIVLMRVIQIAHRMLARGYLIRGGISVGLVWHMESNIVGPAYQEAYQIETKTSAPRVELSKDAQEYWMKREGGGNRMCLSYMRHFMVNLLHDYYACNSSHKNIEQAFESYRRLIKKNLDEIQIETVRYKWQWFNEYMKHEMKNNGFNLNDR